jgi:hypothetical protein
MQTTLNVILLLLNTAIVGAGIYLTAYLKKKAQNLATREEFQELVKQTAALTRTTAQIETDIKGDLWDRQKRWELRRDALFELTKRLGLLKDAVTALLSVYQNDLKHGLQGDFNRTANRIKRGQECLDAASAFDNAILMVMIVCDEKLEKAAFRFSLTMRDIAAKAREWDAETLDRGARPLGLELALVTDAIRTELDRISEPKPQSSVSSGAPTPG